VSWDGNEPAILGDGWIWSSSPPTWSVVEDAPGRLEASPFSLWLSADTLPPGAAELEAVLVAHEDVDAIFGVFARVERWDGVGWRPHAELVMCMDHWHCTARVQPSGGIEAVPAIGLVAQPGVPGPVERFTIEGLDAGWYRISQEANEGLVASAILQIVDGAPASPPLLPIDQAGISVSPALLPPDGGDVVLYPLIPAPTGAQSREDVIAATRGLSEVARIERWTGTSWETVADVGLEEADDDLARSASVPPLPEGAYRLVREGPDAPHVGHFWIDDVG
jgi:hypothetical protein